MSRCLGGCSFCTHELNALQTDEKAGSDIIR